MIDRVLGERKVTEFLNDEELAFLAENIVIGRMKEELEQCWDGDDGIMQ